MDKNALRGKWALVTGASSGMGVEFARQLAKLGCNLVLVARRKLRLDELATELTAQHAVAVEAMVEDLSRPDAAVRLCERIKDAKRTVDILVNNAGFGLHGDFVTLAWSAQAEMLSVDIVTLTQLTHLLGRDMAARGSGFILQVASIGSFQATPTYAVYSAAKAYVLSLGEAIASELKKSGVRVSTLCPGVTATEFHEVAGQKENFFYRLTVMQPDRVARAGLDGLFAGRPCIVPGWINKLAVWSQRLVPRRVTTAVAGRSMQA